MSTEDTLRRLAQERQSVLRELDRNTKAMKQAIHLARAQGYYAPTLAKLLGVTKRTVYQWMR